MMYTYKVKFQLGKMPYYVWVDAEDDDAAKAAAKKKVRAAYGRKRQYLHLSMENLGEAAPMPPDPPQVFDSVGELVMPGDVVMFDDDIKGVVELAHDFPDMPDNFYKKGDDYFTIGTIDEHGTQRIVKTKGEHKFLVLRESDAVEQPDA